MSHTLPRYSAIIHAALACFVEHGVEKTTIDMIRAASGASVGSLYHHFGNKEGLAAEVYLEGLRQVRAQTQAALSDCQDLQSAIAGIINTHIDWIVDNPDWAQFVFSARRTLANTPRDAELRHETAKAQQDLATLFTQLPDGQLLDQWPADVVPSLIVGPLHDYARNWLEGRRRQSPAELREAFCRAAWGILRQAG